MASIGDLYTRAALFNTQLCTLSYVFFTGRLTSCSSECAHCNLADGSKAWHPAIATNACFRHIDKDIDNQAHNCHLSQSLLCNPGCSPAEIQWNVLSRFEQI